MPIVETNILYITQYKVLLKYMRPNWIIIYLRKNDIII